MYVSFKTMYLEKETSATQISSSKGVTFRSQKRSHVKSRQQGSRDVPINNRLDERRVLRPLSQTEAMLRGCKSSYQRNNKCSNDAYLRRIYEQRSYVSVRLRYAKLLRHYFCGPGSRHRQRLRRCVLTSRPMTADSTACALAETATHVLRRKGSRIACEIDVVVQATSAGADCCCTDA